MILYCTRDLIFATRIRSTAEAMNLVVRPARDIQTLQERLDRIDDGRGNDPVTGVIVDLDMRNDAIAIIDQTKTHDPAIGVVAFGPHVQVEILDLAREHGSNFVMARSQFNASLHTVLERLSSQNSP